MLDLGIMAKEIPIEINMCVKHNDDNIRGVIVKDVNKNDDNIVVLTEKNVEEKWPKNNVTTISSSDMRCHKIKSRIASAERYGISLGGKRHTKRVRRHSRKSHKSRRHYK